MTTLNNVPVVNQPFLYINDMQVSNDATTPNTKLDIAAGQCRDSTNTIDIILDDAVTLNAAVNGYNGLDTGTFAASTIYTVYAIADSSAKNPSGVIMSASLTTPTLPFGYDAYRRIGFAKSDGSIHFLLFTTEGNGNSRTHHWDTMIQVLNDGTATSLTNISLATAVPAIDKLGVYVDVEFTPATANDTVRIAPGGSSATVMTPVYGNVAAKISNGNFKVVEKLVSSAPTIRYINSASSGNTDVFVTAFDYYV